MNQVKSAEMMLHLANAFGKKTSQSELATWYDLVFSTLDEATAHAAIKRIMSEDASRFPTIPHFIEVAKGLRKAIGGGGKRIEIEPGVWVDYDQWRIDHEAEKREWAATAVTDDQRLLNLRGIDEIFEQQLGIRRKSR